MAPHRCADELEDVLLVDADVPVDPLLDTDRLDEISAFVNAQTAALRVLNLTIHDNPELGYHEFVAHDVLTRFMEARGWKVTRSAYGIATAFVAVFDSGVKGPVVSFNAEYDCLKDIGHACGHNLIATASVAAALATAECIQQHKLKGKVILFGTPAEEGGGGKIRLLDAGAYKDHGVDVSLMAHPGNVESHALVSTAAYESFTAEYSGKEAHAAAQPWEGINALDGLITAYNGLSALRQQTKPKDIIQGHITNGGLAPNIIHAYASGNFVIRAENRKRLQELRKPEYPIPQPQIDFLLGFSNASTDQGNISYAMPSLHAGFCIDAEAGPHTPKFTEAARTQQAHDSALTTGKALAATAVEVLSRQGYLREIKEEWAKNVGSQ
ncbi:hypothetical protein BD626DRAFT_504930 [Schizophyllum amplum]|uniref:Peptidase M20 domain-containing protein 2 n=1 Tax=Schizophyllum amplum TaxID=97359 RepID=A0A550C6H0_9AGAR|nr:hypothetical protein BD626DRAFT_504930 [Auriculariopsis ampla]